MVYPRGFGSAQSDRNSKVIGMIAIMTRTTA